MAKIQCAISGITYSCNHGPLSLSAKDGYYHPIFALPYKKLYGLYSKHCAGELTHTDSYLLFLAFLHSMDKVHWRHHATCNPKDQQTVTLIENNLAQLIRVIEATNCIRVPSFRQPSFVVSGDNSQLAAIPNWIGAWEKNIADFRDGYASIREREDIVKTENRLSYYIKSGSDPKQYAYIVASWANKAADFPAHRAEDWMRLIRSCFNSSKMFSTPLADIKEVREYCEENIEHGSIHCHALMSTLKEGAARHSNFLGLSLPNSLGYTLLPADSDKNDAEIEAIIAKAPAEQPVRTDYESDIAFLRAKLRYKVAKSHAPAASDSNPPSNPPTDTSSQESKL